MHKYLREICVFSPILLIFVLALLAPRIVKSRTYHRFVNEPDDFLGEESSVTY